MNENAVTIKDFLPGRKNPKMEIKEIERGLDYWIVAMAQVDLFELLEEVRIAQEHEKHGAEDDDLLRELGRKLIAKEQSLFHAVKALGEHLGKELDYLSTHLRDVVEGLWKLEAREDSGPRQGQST